MTPSNRNRMLTKEELETLWEQINSEPKGVVPSGLPRLVETALALYAVKDAAENSCCEDPCYGNCRVSIDEALDALREGKR